MNPLKFWPKENQWGRPGFERNRNSTYHLYIRISSSVFSSWSFRVAPLSIFDSQNLMGQLLLVSWRRGRLEMNSSDSGSSETKAGSLRRV